MFYFFSTFRAIVTGPHGLAEAGLGLEVECTVAAAVRQALQRFLVHLTAVGTFPALFADARALGAETVAGASRMRTVDLLAVLALVAAHTVALAVGAVPVPVAIGHLALVVSQGALLALPAGITLALAVYVLA